MRNRIKAKSIAFGDEDGSATVTLEVRLWPRNAGKKMVVFDPTNMLLALQDYLDNLDGDDDGKQE